MSSPIEDYTQYLGTTRLITLLARFSDPGASAAVRLTTVLGVMNITLDGEQAPITVANFLNYVNSGRYFKLDPTTNQIASSFFHRSVPNYVIQSGGYIGTVKPGNEEGAIQPVAVETFAAVQNEPAISNTRGTIAMAKSANAPNSATSQWFINLNDNSHKVLSNTDVGLDVQNGGYTVFGRVAADGMGTADAIAAVRRYNLLYDPRFTEIPLRDIDEDKPIRVVNLISIPEFVQISPLQFSASSSNPNVVSVTVSATNLLVTALQPGSAQISITATDLDGVSVSDSFNVNVIAAPGRIRNISARVDFPQGSETLTGGFIIRGGPTQRLVVRARGLSSGAPGALDDPSLELIDQNNQVVASNDNWISGPNKQELMDLQIAPGDDKEAAVFVTVPSSGASPVSYTARVRSANGKSGVGLVEIFDVSAVPGSTLRNISALGPVGTDANVLIGGFIVRGSDSRRLVVRGIGPSLSDRGVAGALPDPQVVLRNNQGMVVDSNDNWETHPNASEIQQFGLAPQRTAEAALIVTLPASEYTATVSGVGTSPTGVGQVEVFQVQ
ncbi:MAG: peptidylprolyl isomerase [Chthoniobacterales bacterium]